MLQNYFKIAWRNLIRRKFYVLVTLLGLSISITFALLIGSYISGELQVNRTLRNAEQQWLVQSRWKSPGMGNEIASLAPLGPTLKSQYPTLVANYYRLYGVTAIVSQGQTHFRESIQVGDSTLLPMFGFPLLHGNPKTALQQPNTIVLTAEKARKFFGTTDVLNRSLTVQTPVGGKQVFTVTGVLEDLPPNSVTQLFAMPDGLFIPMRNAGYFMDPAGMESWQNNTIVTYVELRNEASPTELTRAISQLIAANAPEHIKTNFQPYLISLPDHHLKANNGLIEKLILTLSLVAVFILLMAVVNFVNITIGTSASRLREIGVRKALGGQKKQIAAQFLTEALMLTGMAVLLGLIGYELGRSAFAQVLGKPIVSLLDWSGYAFLAALSLLLLVGLLAGGYPAFVLAALPSVETIKGKLTAVSQPLGLRRTLIIFQFTVAIAVFISAVVIARQVAYFFDKTLGYQKEQVLAITSVPRDWSKEGVERMQLVRNRFTRIPGVRSASLSFEIPDGASEGNANMFVEGQDSTQAITTQLLSTDEQFTETYQMRMAAGQFFGKTYDQDRIVLNEAAARALGWKKPVDALGKRVRLAGMGSATVSGVVQNFHFSSLRDAIQPLAFFDVRTSTIYRYLSFKLEADRIPETISAVQQEWTKTFPDAPFEYKFMDDTLQKLYQTETQLRAAARLATALALIIVLLGVLGLVSLNVTQRTKEIGIRKVLGASVPHIIGLFLREFVSVIIVANLIAWPLAYWLLNNWLSRFAYRQEISWQPFALVAVVLVLLTAGLVSLQTIKTALLNPVKSLKTE
ncbi:ABC transporter permease [Tellurirhabdus bombi]|uniref:ABC transporter permease n=1 Tax=Tellurirhabdus bombi TaxID=2907205 RepID=UPI001F1CB88A|nr:ABC transporter permease [Tellurirhabdus bombi]